MPADTVLSRLAAALDAREKWLTPPHNSAVRLCNGFLEGVPELVAEVYGETLVLFNHATPPEAGEAAVQAARTFYRERLPWLRCVWVKTRHAGTGAAGPRNGRLVDGTAPAEEISEYGVRYALDLALNQDGSFYLDTRLLRRWALDHLAGKRVLNTFAHTGSLGVAALAGGAREVLHLDRNRTFLELARASHERNGHDLAAVGLQVVDFFAGVSRLKRERQLFDCIFLDPPFFAAGARSTVNLVSESARLINKVRPLIADGGWLVAVNNALFVSGAEYLRTLEALAADGYLALEALVPVPEDCIGNAATRVRSLPVDPAPFNHATKIALLRVRRKTGAG